MKSVEMVLLFWLFAVQIISGGYSLKILGIFPIPARSHYILGSALMRNLAERGHDVTVISAFGEKDLPKNGSYRDVVLTGFVGLGGENMDLFAMDQMSPFAYILMVNSFGTTITDKFFNHTNVQNLLKSDATFDVVILEQFLNDAQKVLAHHYNAPLIIFSTFGSSSWVNPLVANPAPPSFVPELMLNFSPNKFFDRLKNSLVSLVAYLNRNLYFFPAQNRITKKYFPDAPDLDELNYNASLVLLNSHVSTNQAVPRVPSMIDIGGYHVQPPKKLPGDLQKFLDESKEGVIYFSMGSALQSSKLPVEKREAILRAFASLKMKVLWKWEEETLPGQPGNVKLGKWLPQQDILAHPNVKLFITHGGLLSLIETVYHGVPILVIPIFGDQKINAANVASNGYGLYLPYGELTEEKLQESITEILSNAKYAENVKRRSKIMHDRESSPMDTAEFWIKYVVRHQGAPHLRILGLDLKWYQYFCLDVAVFMLGSSVLCIYVLAYLLRRVCRSRSKNKLKQT